MTKNIPKLKALTTFTSQGARPGQEDFLLSVRERNIFVVADGFGGPLVGAEVAKTACEAIRTYLVKEAGDLEATLPFVLRSYFSLAGNVLFNSLIFANRKVITLNRNKNMNEKGGASVLAAFIDGDMLALANVGICTAWLFREGRRTELVVPRSYQRLLDPFGHENFDVNAAIPLMALGMSEDLQPEILEYRIQDGDWLTLQTDGMPSSVDEMIASVQSKGMNEDDSLKEVTQNLSEQSYSDNAAISLILF